MVSTSLCSACRVSYGAGSRCGLTIGAPSFYPGVPSSPTLPATLSLPAGTQRGNICTVSGRISHNDGATVYTIAASFLGAAAGGAWLGLILMSLAGLYGNIPLWKALMAGTIAGAVVAALAILCGRAAGRLAGLRVILVAAIAVLNVAAALYFFGGWVCEVSPAGPAFTNCQIPAPLGGLSLPGAVLLLSPTFLAAVIGASTTIRGLLRCRHAQRGAAPG